jgi:hypothetical protein
MHSLSKLLVLFIFASIFSLEWMGYYDTPGTALKVTIEGKYAYVADGSGGLLILDVSNPAAPLRTGSLKTPGYAQAVAVSGTTAFVADWKSGLAAIDVSNPASPSLIGSYSISGQANDVAVRQGYAYLAMDKGLVTMDGVPGTPIITSSFPMPTGAWRIQVISDRAYVVDYLGDVWMFDLTTPDSPALISPNNSGGSWGSSTTILSMGIPLVFYPGQLDPSGLSNWIYYFQGPLGTLQFFDFNGGYTFQVGEYTPPRGAACVTLSGKTAYVADNEAGVQILNINYPVMQVMPLNASIYSGGVSCSDGHAYIFSPYQFNILDMGNPGLPVVNGTLSFPDGLNGVEASGNLALVKEKDSLTAIDVSDPLVPVVTGTVPLTYGLGAGMAIGSGAVYATDGSEGLKIFSLSPSLALSLSGVFDTPGFAADLVLEGNLAYVADWLKGLQIIDVTNPSAPALAGSVVSGFTATAIEKAGDLVFLAEDTYGFEVVDVSNPALPRIAGHYDTPGYTVGFALMDHFLFVADKCSRIPVYDISDPDSLRLVKVYYTASRCQALEVIGTRLLSAEGSAGLNIFDLSDLIGVETALPATAPALSLSNTPNPFNASTRVQYSLPSDMKSPCRVKLSVYDAGGRLIRTLDEGVKNAGGHAVAWDASALPSGVYLFRLEAAGRTLVRRGVLIR